MKHFILLNNSEFHKLTRDNFEKYTRKANPYYQVINGKARHYAQCPICKNVVQVINLYPKEDLNSKGIYAKHIDSNIAGFPIVNKFDKENCPNYSKKSLNSRAIKANPDKYNEIIGFIDKHKNKIFHYIRIITGVNFKKSSCEEMLSKFLAERGYYYDVVSVYNIPYMILNLANRTSIYGEYVKSNSFIPRPLMENSNCYKLSDLNEGYVNYSKFKDNRYKKEIVIYFLKFKNENEKVEMIIEETYEMNYRKHTIELAKIDLDIDVESFWKIIEVKI